MTWRREWTLAVTGAGLVAGVAGGGSGDLSFTDVTAEIGMEATHDAADSFALGVINLTPMIGGGAAGDFNGDGWQDFFLVTSGGESDKLFLSDGVGGFTESAEAWGVDTPHLGMGCAVGDFNNDGWLDIYICSLGPPTDQPQAGFHKLYRNDEGTGFTEVAEDMGVQDTGLDGLGAAFGDYDLDGDLDLAVACWAGVGIRLFRNDGDSFADVTVEAGLEMPWVRAFSPCFIDMNGDRWPELLMAADFGTSRYLINNRDGTFTDATVRAGTGLDGNGMGHAIADLNGDLLLDWYVTSIHSEVEDGPPQIPGTGNMLYLAAGPDEFNEMSGVRGVNDGGWGWGTLAIDIDHDGDIDLLETNGWPLANNEGDLEWNGEQSYLFEHQEDGTYIDIAVDCGFANYLQGRGLVNLDLENDGDQDIIFIANEGPLNVYRNNVDNNTHRSLRIFLDTSANPRLAPNGFGTIVYATVSGQTRMRPLTGHSNYMSQSELTVHFGFGSKQSVDELRVHWNDGTVTVLEDIPTGQTITISAPYASDLNGDGQVSIPDLLALILAWGRGPSPADLNQDGFVDMVDLLVLLENWNP